MRISGKLWVTAILGLGAAAGTFAVLYWESPRNSSRWSFSQIHTSLSRDRRDAAARFLGPVVVLNGERLEREAFLDAYDPGKADPHLDVVACPVRPGHWDVGMAGRTWCFNHEAERNIWLLHRVGPSPCACTSVTK